MIRRARESDAEAVTALLAQLDYPFGADEVRPVLGEVLADPAHVVLMARARAFYRRCGFEATSIKLVRLLR